VQFRDAAAELLIGGEFGCQICRDEILGQPGPDDLRADTHDVDVWWAEWTSWRTAARMPFI
jgi:hypothetical protein